MIIIYRIREGGEVGLGSNVVKRIKGEWEQRGGVRQRIPEFVHKGGHQEHCTSTDNA